MNWLSTLLTVGALLISSNAYSNDFNTTTKSDSNYSYVDVLDLSAYDGYWYEVYKDRFDETFQKKGSCVTANYTIWDNGDVGIMNCELLPNGELSLIGGYAYYEDDNSGGELTVKLDGVPTAAPYWIIELGPMVEDQYDYAIVSDNVQLDLFVLARDVDRFFSLYDDSVLQSLYTMGFNTTINGPQKTDQNKDCIYI